MVIDRSITEESISFIIEVPARGMELLKPALICLISGIKEIKHSLQSMVVSVTVPKLYFSIWKGNCDMVSCKI